MATQDISIFECAWPDFRVEVPLVEAALVSLYIDRRSHPIMRLIDSQKYVKLAEFFLKLSAHFPKNSDGAITDEALVYSEWRYIVYTRFLHYFGLTPHERPPPWYVYDMT